MNSNTGLFDEDRNLCFEDMEWNVDSVFSGGSAPDSDFDLSKVTQDFLEGGSALQASSGMVPPSTFAQQPNNEHISPRGIAENVEPHNSCDGARETHANPKQVLLKTPATVEQQQGERPHHSSSSQKNESEPEAHEKSAADREDSPATPPKEASRQGNGLVNVDSAESPIHAHQQVDGHKVSHYQQQSALTQEQVPNLGEDLDAALRTEIPYQVNQDSNEFPGTGYGASNITSDPIESLVELPDHVRFNGDLDPILHLQSMDTPADADETPQDFLQLQIQVPHQELMVTSVQGTHQVDLSSNDVISNYEPSLMYRPEPQHEQRPNGMSSISVAPTFLQAHTGSPEQNNITPSPGMHLDTQTIQEVVQAYQSNVHPHLQSPLTSDYSPLGNAYGASSASADASIPIQPLLTHRYSAPVGSGQGLPVQPADGIVKKRGRKKGVRDPTKPPPTPRRRKAYPPRGKSGEQAVSLPGDVVASGTFQRTYAGTPAARSSTDAFASDPAAQFRPRSTGRPATSVGSGIPSSPAGEIQLSSSRVQPKDATRNTVKGLGGVGSGRVVKKSGRKGGRVNPETAHLSVEERRSLRAKRNRESAEKSRVRRKVQTAELEMSVAELRIENKSLKNEVLRFQAQLSRTSTEITQHCQSPAEQEQVLREQAPALVDALMVLQRIINECPRTFRPHPHSPEIQLKIRR